MTDMAEMTEISLVAHGAMLAIVLLYLVFMLACIQTAWSKDDE